MNWELKEGALRSESKIHRAKIVRDHQPNSPGYILDLQIGSHPTYDFKTSFEAEKWAESRMNEFKKEFILSLIVEEEGSYIFGKDIMKIAKEDDGIWFLYGSGYDIITEGTLEECKNYIVSCF